MSKGTSAGVWMGLALGALLEKVGSVIVTVGDTVSPKLESDNPTVSVTKGVLVGVFVG